MHRKGTKLVAACLATGALGIGLADLEASSRLETGVARVLGHRGISVARVSANPFTGKLTLGGIAAEYGRWHVTAGIVRLPLPSEDFDLVSAAHAFPMGDAPEDKPALPKPPPAPAETPKTATSTAGAAGSASAENVVITDGSTTYRVKRIDLVGTALSNQDLAALLDSAKPEPVEVRLRKVTAASITIPELTIDIVSGATEEHWTQKQILLADVRQGKASVGSAGPSDIQVKSGDDASKVEVGGLQFAGLDIGQLAHFVTAARADDGEKLVPFCESFVANAFKLIDVKDKQTFTIGSIKEQGVKGRALKTDLLTQSRRRDTEKTDSAATNAFLNDLFSSVSVDLLQIDDVASFVSGGAKPSDMVTFGIEQIAGHDLGDGNRIGDMSLKNFHLENKQGRMTLASIKVGGFSLPLPAASSKATNDASADTKIPILAKLEVASFRVDMIVPAKDEADKRLTFAIERVDYSATGLEAGRIPAKSAVSVGHLTYEVPPNDPSMEAFRELGYKRLDLSSKIATSYDAKQQTLSIEKFALEGVDMGLMDLKLDLGNVSDKIVSQNPEISKASAIAMIFKDMDITLNDNGLIDRALKYRATIDGKSLDEERQLYINYVETQLPQIAGGSPKLKPLVDALAKFIAAPKTLHVAVVTKNGLGAADMGLLGDPNALLDQLDIRAAANE